MEDLKHYLDSDVKNIEEAIRLFEAYGNNKNLLETAKRNKTKNIHATLDYELHKLFKRLGGVFVQAKVEVIEPNKNVQHSLPYVDTHNTIDTLVRQQQHFYNLGAKLSNQLVEVSKTNPHSIEAKILVSKILEAKAKYNELAEQKKHFAKYGKIEETKKEESNYGSMKKEELLKKQKLLRTQISKAKKAFSENKTNEDKFLKYKNKVAELQKELLIVENLLCN